MNFSDGYYMSGDRTVIFFLFSPSLTNVSRIYSGDFLYEYIIQLHIEVLYLQETLQLLKGLRLLPVLLNNILKKAIYFFTIGCCKVDSSFGVCLRHFYDLNCHDNRAKGSLYHGNFIYFRKWYLFAVRLDILP